MQRSTIVVVFGFLLLFSSIAVPRRSQTEVQPNLVKLDVIVVDRSNHSVDDVQKEDLQLFDEGSQQTISHFAREERAAKYGIVIDTSGSLRSLFPAVKAAVTAIVQANRADDQTFVTRFVSSDKIQTVQELTSDKPDLMKAINGLSVEAGQTAVIDGIYAAAAYAVKHRTPNERVALVLISDGEDRASHYTEKGLLKYLRENRIQVFAIGLVRDLDDEKTLIRTSPKKRAIEFLKRLGTETGGRAFFIESEKDLTKSVFEIAHDLRIQYAIGYTPNHKPDLSERKVQVKVINSPGRENRTAITRSIINMEGALSNKPGSKQP